MKYTITLLLSLMLSISISFSQSEAGRLSQYPDLSPLLSKAEVKDAFRIWERLLSERQPEKDPELLKRLREARLDLSRALPEVDQLTIYSLDPVSDGEMKEEYNTRKQNPNAGSQKRFHGYPVFGMIEVNERNSANRLKDFFGEQIITGGWTACGFKPRHGFRLISGSIEIDFIMCFECHQLLVEGGPDLKFSARPIFSPAVRDVVNKLLDDQNVKRDKPRNG